MNLINRYNYEEFFLMYVDNELSTRERAEVELFIQQNPDLINEFETLWQTKLSPDEKVMFDAKDELLEIKNKIGIENYEEFFLSYIDKELDENTKMAVERFILQQPQLQDEFSLLKQTILPQEKIVFQSKKSLYRKEERRIIHINWMRFAVAASVIGIAALAWWMTPSERGINNDNIARVQTNKETPALPANDNASVNGNKETQPQITKPLAETKQPEVKEKAIAAVNQYNKKASQKASKDLSESDGVNNIVISKPKKVNEQRSATPREIKPFQNEALIVRNNTTEINTKNDESGNTTARTFVENSKKITAAKTEQLDEDLYIPAIYKEIDTEADDKDQTLYFGSLELNKNKVSGIMKKVGGLFAGRSKNTLQNEDGKLQIANLEFNTN